jgi:hypothetical protein
MHSAQRRAFRGQEIPMKRLVFCSLLLGLAFSAVAQTPAATPAEPAAPQATPAPVDDVATQLQPAPREEASKKNEATDRNCLKETGSRIAPRPDSKGRKCVNASGRSYTKGDLDSTGAIDLSDALRRLDPAVH